MRNRVALVTLLLLALTATTASTARAAPRFQASISTDHLALDQTLEVRVDLTRDGNQAIDGYRAPALPDFDMLHTGTAEQTQYMFINGLPHMMVVETHFYVVKPRKKGVLTIGPAIVKLGGVELRTQPLTVRVTAISRGGTPAAPPGSSAPAAQADPSRPPPEGMHGGEDLFVDASVDKPRVYVGQQVTASWRLYTQSDILKYRSLAEPKHEDFWSEELYVPSGHLAWDRATVKGRDYEVALLLRKALFPLKAGKLAITALEAEATTLDNAFSSNGSDLRRSRSLGVEVLPLPAAGRPAGFAAANVGRFVLSSMVDRATLKAGEAVTWRVTVRGSGNIRNVRLPKLERVDGFRVYEPTTKETIDAADGVVKGEKTYTFLLLPERGGKLELPAVTLPYFDPGGAPDGGRYASAQSTPITITVEGDPSAVAASAAAPATENLLAQQVRPIRNRSSIGTRVGTRLWHGRLAALLLATPPGAWLLVLAVDGLRRRLGRETAGSKRRRARRNARRRLRVAEYHLRSQRPSAFFGELARVLYEHLEYRLGTKVEALTLGELRAFLVQRGFDGEVAEAVVRELEACDLARFAPSAADPGEMRAALKRVRALTGLIESARPSDKEAA